MTKMTPELKFKTLQQCSSYFLTHPFPDNWEDLSDGQQDKFIDEHSWRPLETASIQFVYNAIDDAAIMLRMFLVDNKFVEGTS